MSQPIVRSFTDALASMEDGRLTHDLSEKLQELLGDLSNLQLSGVRDPKGSMTLKIDFKLTDGIIEIVTDVKTKTPDVKRDRSVMWLTPDNNLCRSNPKQTSMFDDVDGVENLNQVRDA